MPIRFVLIGAGRIARRHAEQIRRTGILVAVADPDSGILADFTQIFPVPGFADPSVMLEQATADIAVICSPNGLHFHHVRLALAKGLHVLCEKPFCLRSSEVAVLTELSRQSARQVFLVLSARFHPILQQILAKIRQGAWGRVLSFQLNACWNRPADYYRQSSWRGSRELDGGILYTQFSHYLDALCCFVPNLKPTAVSMKNELHQPWIQGEDSGIALLENTAGTIGSLHWTVNATNRNMEASLLLVLEKATLRLGGTHMQELDWLEIEDNSTGISKTGLPGNTLPGHHAEVYDELLLALSGHSHRLPGPQDGLSSIELIEAIYRGS
ncbi:Gfo/Idh/MocA family protein [Flavihumibacter petaseus]|uniref:Putative oxidoreductase n=1 Tax=Flavihumibacter petaseus NBRC 106054 TaxID=1220578 RepID=A0A0E9N281_9BACT|nr:Gfo/Idh/MocA family oxidoreductase [Flavihumibacter petaseus]GAO43888.1 putative oxidoreductase [Flavihumibacter petaseus NBRC 106054]